MGGINRVARLLLSFSLLLPLAVALPGRQDGPDLEEGAATTATSPRGPAAEGQAGGQAEAQAEAQAEGQAEAQAGTADDMQSDQGLSDAEVHDRMAYLILSFWGKDLHGLDDAPQQDEGARRRQRRDMVFTPLWATKQRHAEKMKAQKRYWAQRSRPRPSARRPSRYGRDVLAARGDGAVDAEPPPPRPLSRVRRQWSFRPLFSTRVRAAMRREQRRRRRQRASSGASLEEVADDGEAADEEARALSRPRREWTDVPLFAVKEIAGERLRERYGIIHAHRQQQEGDRDSRRWWPRHQWYRGHHRRYDG